MEYHVFKQLLLEHLTEVLPDSEQISIQSVRRNNGEYMDSLLIRESDLNIAPSIYLDYYYHAYLSGVPFQSIAAAILKVYEKNKPNRPIDTHFFTEYSRVRPLIAMKLIHYEKNESFLEDVPYVRFLDLAIIFYCMVPMDFTAGSASIVIHRSHLNFWGITEEELCAAARENTPRLLPAVLYSMWDILHEDAEHPLSYTAALPPEKEDDPYPMFVLSNDRGLFGASCILYEDLLASYAREAKTDFYILPSSIHETILLPANHQYSLDELSELVREVNETLDQRELFLSDHAYYFSREEGRLLSSV